MKSKRKVIRKKNRKNPCCDFPHPEYHLDWKDETGRCNNCGKHLRLGNGPLSGGFWPKGSIKGKG
jgi:hypothetical protein